jgi:excisionase family DNA binding protein
MPAHTSPKTSERLYTIAEAAAKWSVSRDTIERLLRRDELRFVQIGRIRRIPESALLEYLEDHQIP